MTTFTGDDVRDLFTLLYKLEQHFEDRTYGNNIYKNYEITTAKLIRDLEELLLNSKGRTIQNSVGERK